MMSGVMRTEETSKMQTIRLNKLIGELNGIRKKGSLPKKPKSPLQRYRLLRKGKDILA